MYETFSRQGQVTPEFHAFATMSLATNGPATIGNVDKPKWDKYQHDRDTNSIHDIQGSKPFLKYTQYTNKPNFHVPDDIGGAKPKQLMRTTNAPDYTLYHDDIEGSKPKPSTFKTTRVVDPLNPDYKLPSYQSAKAPEPKFIKDPMAIDDIKGTRTQPRTKFEPRDTMNVQDIEGTTVGWRPRHARVTKEGPTRDLMNIKDITDGGFKSQRVTDPLRPSYVVNNMRIEDDMVKSQPKKLPKGKNDPFYSLITEDIEGTKPGWKPPHETCPPMSQRRHWRNTNFVGDIDGTSANTVKHAICTNRMVNPLNPAYVSLDGEVLENPTTPLYKTEGVVEANQMLQKSTTKAVQNQYNIINHQQKQSQPPTQGRLQTYSGYPPSSRHNMTADAKEQLISQLEKEIYDLRASQGKTPPTAYMSPSQRYSSPIQYFSHTAPNLQGNNSLRTAGSSMTRDYSREEFVPPRSSLPPSGRQSNNLAESKRSRSAYREESPGYVLKSQSSQNRNSMMSSERLILQSSNGEPRVQLTPAEKREAKAFSEEINRVRDLI